MMKSALGGLLIAVLLLAAGALSLSQAGATRRLADSHQLLATLQYDLPSEEEGIATVMNRLPGPAAALHDDQQRYRANVTYWLGRYESLTELTAGTGVTAPSDPAILLVAANAAFRASAPQGPDRRAAVERLDGVIQGYADVLRKDPAFDDAAYNYEYVVRLRDTIAKAPAQQRPAARDRKPAAAAKAPEVSVDLPAGPTIHGRPGGPPEGTDMSDFKTITPMRYDEREEQMDPGRGRAIRRKG
jgi:hypothetical protein